MIRFLGSAGRCRRAILAAGGVALAFMVVPTAFADPLTALNKLRTDPVQGQRMINVAARSSVFQNNPCPGARFGILAGYIPIKPLTVDAADRITSGSWEQGFLDMGCGSRRRLNILVSIDATGSMSLTPLLPGTTHAGPVLQADGVRYAFLALPRAMRGDPSCHVSYVADTQFVAEDKAAPLPGAAARGWRESWTLALCTRTIVMPMHFIPNADGTYILAGSNTQSRIFPWNR